LPRWIAYRGETIPLQQYVTAPAHSLVVQSQRALESTAATNPRDVPQLQ
jgi:glutamine amidotransferase